MDGFGTIRGPLLSTLASGAVGLLVLCLRRGEIAKLRKLPRAYWLACGGLFAAYVLAANIGIGLARSARQVLLFSVLNYLWPALTVVFSALFFRHRVRPWIGPGLLLAMAGILLAFLSRPGAQALTLQGLLDDLASNPPVYLLGLFCGVTWGLYSNLGRKIAGASDANPVPILFLAAGVVFGVASLLGAFRGLAGTAASGFVSVAAVGALAYKALVVDLVAYVGWDLAMRRGNQVLAAAASFLTPLLSGAAIAVALGSPPGWLFWAACALSIGGAVVCRLSVSAREP